MPLKVSDGMGAWIDDFQKSDAPQFKGKNKEERREMAIAAYLDAKRGPQKESVELDESKKMKRMSLRQIEKEMDQLDKAMEKMGRGGYAYDSMMDAWDDLNDMKKKLKKEAADDDTVRMIKANPKMKAKILRGLTPKARREIEKALKEDVELEENKARQSADLAKAMAAFKKRGGKIKRVAPGKAAGYHGKDDPGAGVHGMMDRPDTKGMPRRKKVRSLRAGVEESMNVYRVGHSKMSGNIHAKDEKDALNQLRKKGLKGPIRLTHRGKASQQIQRNSVNEEMMFKVSVEGLPPMIMLGRSPGDIKGQLRKIVKQPSMITDVERMTKADVRKRYRDMAKGDGDEEA